MKNKPIDYIVLVGPNVDREGRFETREDAVAALQPDATAGEELYVRCRRPDEQ